MELIRFMAFWVVLSLSLAVNAQTQKEYLTVVDRISLMDLREAMIRSGDHGVNTKSYWSDSMESTYLQDSGNPNLKSQANLNFLRLLRDVSSGVVDPALVGVDVKLTRKVFPTVKELEAKLVAVSYNPWAVLEAMSPQSPQYLALRDSLRKLDRICQAGEWVALPKVKKTLKLGSKDPVLIPLKSRMSQLGYTMNSLDNAFDDKVVAAVNDIQWNLRFKPDSKISPGGKTWKYLNVSCQERMRQVRLDMEKLRWFPQYFEDRYIFVNLAMSYFSLVDKTGGSLYTMSFRTINGRPERKSPTMKDKIVYLVINPFWVVPPTIFREDKVEEIKNLWPWEIRQYFDSHNYEVWNKSFTQKLDPASIDWYNMDPNQDANIYIRQRPHRMNALGSLKFMMTNSYAIYLHDTNQRELFVEPHRLLSSGCVRVEKPVDLAEYLMRGTAWDRRAIERYMAKPGEVLDNDTRVQLKQPMPVYMVFLTSQLSSDGVLRFAEDSYKQGTRLLRLGAW
ncbi:L,D-transpeptidase family protein [Bdellovibrio bacteriovorus]|uniref:L,D-transpeptidase family protein n=1 Tax=Bdellovibrio bacteriovorus TaxID=959 RepID=UPI0021CE9C62|nr:L,D-transpeptidase family protein [Bdellovibrio bacteriovorus]UXR64897.1 L,D-transpeptidase family protein [Bdellovibrio bacteriovorus]